MAVTTKVIPVTEGNPHPLGRHQDHDDRSRDFPFVATVGLPGPVLWQHHGPVLDQKALGSCTGNAMEQCLATGPLYRAGFTPAEKQAIQIYSLATKLDGVPGQYPPTDTGSSGLSACKAAQQILFNGKPLITSYQHAFGIDHAKQTIATTPFMVGSIWYDAMFQPDSGGFVHPSAQVAGGHEYACFGYDGYDVWGFLQSWGHWGVGLKGVASTGVFYMHNRDFANLLEAQGDITIPVR